MKACVAANSSPPAATAMSHQASRIEPTARAMPVSRWRIDSDEVIWKRYHVGNMKGEIGRSMTVFTPDSADGSRLLVSRVVLPSEASQQTHHIVVVFLRWWATADDPVE